MVLLMVRCFGRLRRRFDVLSRHHYLVILITILVPVGLPLAIGRLPLECWWIEALIHLGVLVLWALCVVIVFSWLVERDVGEVNQLLDAQTGPLAEELQTLREYYGNSMDDLRAQLRDLERLTRSYFESVGAELAAGSVPIRASATVGPMQLSVTLLKKGGGNRVGVGERVRRVLRRLWWLFWG